MSPVWHHKGCIDSHFLKRGRGGGAVVEEQDIFEFPVVDVCYFVTTDGESDSAKLLQATDRETSGENIKKQRW